MIDLYQFDNANNDGDKEAVQVPNVPTLVNKLSANETNGIKDKLNELVQNVNILENSDLPKDQLLSKAEITITGNDVDVVGSTRYVINETAYEILTPETFTINYTAAGLFRSDIIVVDINGDYLLISGVEGAVAIKPDVPIGTLEFAEFDVTDSSITEFVDVNNFWITKADKGDVGGGGEILISKTYSELLALIGNSSLIVGQKYLLSDYETTYTQPVTGLSKSSGVIEPLILTAITVNKFANKCYSTLYPQDIVYYEITGDIDNGFGTEGFTKGKIYRRIDTIRNNDIGTDWRHVKYDRLGVDTLLFEDYTGCKNNTIKTYYLFNNIFGNYCYSNTFGDYCYSNTFGDNFGLNTFGYNCFSNTFGDACSSNTFGDSCYSNTFGDSCYLNTLEFGYNSNTFGNDCYSNTFGDGCSSNTFGDGCYSNTFGNDCYSNTFGNYCYSNTFGDDSYSNTFGNDCFSNTFGYNCYLNTFGNDCYSNTFGDGCSSNTFQNLPIKNTVFKKYFSGLSNFLPTAEMQNPSIELTVFKTENNTKYQQYYNDSGILITTPL